MIKKFVREILSLPNPFHRSYLDECHQDAFEKLVTAGSCAAPLELTTEVTERLVRSIDSCHNYKETDQLYRVYERPLDIDEMILDIALSEENLCLVDRYFKRTCVLADIDVRVVRPARPFDIRGVREGRSSSSWHRDIRGRQLKIMYYLTDVHEGETSFEYIPYTHGDRTYNYNESRMSHHVCEWNTVQSSCWVSPRGSGMIFDTNLIHRLRRSPLGKPRYSVTFYYTPGQSVMPYSLANAKALSRFSALPKSRLKGLSLGN